jgi:hypothetical protein
MSSSSRLERLAEIADAILDRPERGEVVVWVKGSRKQRRVIQWPGGGDRPARARALVELKRYLRGLTEWARVFWAPDGDMEHADEWPWPEPDGLFSPLPPPELALCPAEPAPPVQNPAKASEKCAEHVLGLLEDRQQRLLWPLPLSPPPSPWRRPSWRRPP